MERKLRTIWTFVQDIEPGKKEHGDTWFNYATGQGWVWDAAFSVWSVFTLSSTAGQGICAYSWGTANSPSNPVGKFLFATEVLSSLATSPRQCSYGAVSSYQDAFTAGGFTLTPQTYINRMPFSTEITLAWGTTLGLARHQLSGANAVHAGYFMGGGSGSAVYSAVDRLYFTSEAVTYLASALTAGRSSSTCNDCSFASYLPGTISPDGNVLNEKSNIVKFMFSTEQSNVIGSALPSTRFGLGGADSPSYGYLAGGGTYSGGPLQLLSSIHALHFSDEVLSNISSTLATARTYPGGTQSNAFGYWYNDRMSFSQDTVAVLASNSVVDNAVTENRN